MGFKLWCQVGGGGKPFSKLPYIREFSKFWFQKFSFFLLFLIGFIRFFFENLKKCFCFRKLKKGRFQTCNIFFIGLRHKIGDGVSKRLQCPFEVQGRSPWSEGPGLRMGWTGRTDGRSIKNVHQFSSYFVGIYNKYTYMYLYK